MNIILTGCDKNTEWQLPWFVENFKKYAGKGNVDYTEYGPKV